MIFHVRWDVDICNQWFPIATWVIVTMLFFSRMWIIVKVGMLSINCQHTFILGCHTLYFNTRIFLFHYSCNAAIGGSSALLYGREIPNLSNETRFLAFWGYLNLINPLLSTPNIYIFLTEIFTAVWVVVGWQLTPSPSLQMSLCVYNVDSNNALSCKCWYRHSFQHTVTKRFAVQTPRRIQW